MISKIPDPENSRASRPLKEPVKRTPCGDLGYLGQGLGGTLLPLREPIVAYGYQRGHIEAMVSKLPRHKFTGPKPSRAPPAQPLFQASSLFPRAGRQPQLRGSLLEEFREVALGVGIPEDSIFTMADRGKWHPSPTLYSLFILCGSREHLPSPWGFLATL